jgi:protein AaeX
MREIGAEPDCKHAGMGERAVIGELDIYGVYIPIFVVVAGVAFLLQILLKRVLDACGLYRFLWHRALFDLAMYVILLGLVTAAAASILPRI